MKKLLSLIVGGLAIVAAGLNAYFLFFKGEKEETASTDTSTAAVNSSSADETLESSQMQAEGQYVDGVYTGQVTSTNRGDYQVQVTISGGQLTDITMLTWPKDNPTSEQINADVLPVYTAEALETQSAELTQISGASEAYKGFTGSLQDALVQAQ